MSCDPRWDHLSRKVEEAADELLAADPALIAERGHFDRSTGQYYPDEVAVQLAAREAALQRWFGGLLTVAAKALHAVECWGAGEEVEPIRAIATWLEENPIPPRCRHPYP